MPRDPDHLPYLPCPPQTLPPTPACNPQGELPTLTDPWVREDLTSQYHRDLPTHTWLGLRSYGDGQVGVSVHVCVYVCVCVCVCV